MNCKIKYNNSHIIFQVRCPACHPINSIKALIEKFQKNAVCSIFGSSTVLHGLLDIHPVFPIALQSMEITMAYAELFFCHSSPVPL